MPADPLSHLLRILKHVAARLRRRLRKDLLATLGRAGSHAERFAAVREVLRRHAPELTQLASDSLAVSWLTGAGRVASWLPRDWRQVQLPDWWQREGVLDDWGWQGSRVFAPVVRAAVRDLQAKQLVTRPEYDQLTEAAKRKAFTVAGLADARALEKVRTSLARAVDEGLTHSQAKRVVIDAAVAEALNETVFRTNVERAMSVGMDRVLDVPQVSELFPFEETLPVSDSRLTELCEITAKSGIQGTGIFYRADPVWRRYKPPRHFQCRCGRRAMSVADAARKGIAYAQEWLRTGKQPWPLPLVPEPAVPLPDGWVPHDGGDGALQFSQPWEESRHPRAKDGRFGTVAREKTEAVRKAVGIRKGAVKEAATKAVSRKATAVKAFLDGAKFTLDEAKQLLGRWVKKGLKRLDPESRRALLRTAKLALAVEERLEDGVGAAQAMVKEVARSQGLSEEHVGRVARLVAIADGITRWTVNVPLVHEVVHAAAHAAGPAGMAVAKLGWYLPLGSLAYLAGSLATNPLGTLKAARKVLAERKAEGHGDKLARAAKRFVRMAMELDDVGRATVAELLRRFDGTEDADRQEALLAAALDEAKGDLAKALAMTEGM